VEIDEHNGEVRTIEHLGAHDAASSASVVKYSETSMP
jgi:hypothetical protein